jgi:hypothetical protein
MAELGKRWPWKPLPEPIREQTPYPFLIHRFSEVCQPRSANICEDLAQNRF